MTMKRIKVFLIALMMMLALPTLHAQDLDSGSEPEVKKVKATTLMINEHFIEMPIRDVVDRIADITGKTVTLGKNVSGVVHNLKINGMYWTKALRVIARDVDAYYVERSADHVELTRPPKVTFATDPQGTDIKRQ